MHPTDAVPGRIPPAPVIEPAGPVHIEDGPRHFPAEQPVSVERHSERRRDVRREEPVATWNSWESGPRIAALEASAPWTESYSGETRFYHDGPHTRVVTGPWEVAIRGLGAYGRREVLAHWEIHRSWVTEEGSEVHRMLPGGSEQMPDGSTLTPRGASERRWLAGSELRLSGSSELLYRGASERRLGGASERSYRGASERRLRGASERRLGGASERAPRGASERRLGGASERLQRGASARRLRAGDAGAYPYVEDALDDD
jgi:hypothetical protein